MKTALMAGALALALGGAAYANDGSCVKAQTQNTEQESQNAKSNSQSTQDSWRVGTTADQKTVVGGMYEGDQAHQQGIGGSGSAEVASTSPYSNTPTDQAGAQQGQAVTEKECAPAQEQGTGGAGGTVGNRPEYYAPSDNTEVTYEQKPNTSGVTVLLGGGVEGYTGALAPRIAPGPTYGVTLQFRPSDVLGLELAYSGAVNELRDSITGGLDTSGPDIVRNGGRALATVGLTDTPVQPYLLAGIGIQHFDVRGATQAYGFRSDTAGEVPVGLGVRTQVGAFTADLRGNYDVPFDQDLAPGIVAQRNIAGVDTSSSGRYQGELRIGATF